MREKNKQKTFFKGALILMLFGFLSKIIGAIYRIPLTRIVGAEGMGVYQMVFPLYTLMLTLSSSGLPSSISKLISENLAKNNFKQARRVLKISFLLLIVFSFFCSFLICLLSSSIAVVQGNKNATICYLGIAPAVIFVGLICGFRGYFQGREKMFPTAISQFIEQIVKMGCGVFFASKLIHKGVSCGVLGAMIGITVSELVALIYLFVSFLIYNRKNNLNKLNCLEGEKSNKETIREILSLSIYVSLGGLIMPLTMLIDSSLVINLLKSIGLSKSYSTKLFGLQTGIVGSIVNMPVVLSLGISMSILPCVSRLMAKGNREEAVKTASKAVYLTVLLALPASVGCMVFAEPIVRILYAKSLSNSEIIVATKILEFASVGIFYLALVQVFSGILQGLNKFWVPLISLSVGVVIKTILNVILIRIKCINIMGAEISTVICYMVAMFINLFVLKKNGAIKLDYNSFFVFVMSCLIFVSKYMFNWLIKFKFSYYLTFFMVIFITVIIYFLGVFTLQKILRFCKNKNKLEKNIKKL